MSAIPGSIAIANVADACERIRRAAKLDPVAFKPFHVPEFTGEQLNRQARALAEVDRELREEAQAGEARSDETPKSGSARRASTRSRAKRDAPKD